MDVHLRDLRYFVAVAEELHFTRAAEELRISQPSLSRQIRVLERNLGFPLFERDRRAVALTAAGEALLPRARELLDRWDDALAEAARQDRAAAGVLRVGFQTSVAGPLYQVTVARFTERRPGWTVELRLRPWSDASAGLLDGTSDVAFVWLPVPGQDRLVHQTLWTEPRHVALWCTHPLAERTELSISDLLDEPFVALPHAASVMRDYWLATDERDGRPVRVGAQAETPDETFEAIAARQGVALLAAGNARIYARPGIATRRVVDISDAAFAVAWRAGDERAIVTEFVESAQEAVRICAAPKTAVAGGPPAARQAS
jgi:DNA-binding transcriptional LysR family regulator